MKYIGLVFFAALLYWSRIFFQSGATISEDIHIGLQGELKRIISEYVQKHLPSSKNLKYEKFWTEPVNKDRVRASFSYSFDDVNSDAGNSKVRIEGFAFLNRKESAEKTNLWSFDELHILNNEIDFQDGVVINPNMIIEEDPGISPTESVKDAPAH